MSTQLEAMHKGLIKLKMQSEDSLDVKADWIARFVTKHYPGNQVKCDELTKYGALQAALYDMK